MRSFHCPSRWIGGATAGAAVCAVSLLASAAPRDAQAQSYIDRGMSAYLAGNYPEADRSLRAAIDHCGGAAPDRCSPELLARAHRDLGIVQAGGLRDRATAEQAFAQALELDPSVSVPPGLSTPEVNEAYETAKRQQGSAAAGAEASAEPAGTLVARDAQAEPTPPAYQAPAAVPVVSSAPAVQEGQGDEEIDDHEQAVGRLGIGWFGVSTIPLAGASPGGTSDAPTITPDAEPVREVPAPVVGVRYWFTPNLGIDAGLGFIFTSGSQEVSQGGTSVTVDKESIFGMMVHAGVPIAVDWTRHLTFLVIPEANFGFATATRSAPPGATGTPDADLSGLRFDVGARAGAELQFGFIDMPRLALEASVGAFFTLRTASVSVGNADASDTTLALTTAAFNSPWDIFRSTVAARYYF